MLLCSVAFASCQEWTCDECAEGGPAVGEFLSAEESISLQIGVLLEEVCPQHSDPQYCVDRLPELWSNVGPVIWKEHCTNNICSDLNCAYSSKVKNICLISKRKNSYAMVNCHLRIKE